MTDHNLIQDGLLVLSGGTLTGVAAVLTYRLRIREVQGAETKTMVDNSKAVAEMSLALLTPLERAATKAETRAAELETQVHNLESAMQSLTESLATLTTRFQAEREELQRQIAAVTTERDAVAASLKLLRDELEALRQAGSTAP
jgi:chromosome segregation ATPase